MFGFLLKVVVLAAVVGSVVGIIYIRRGSLPNLAQVKSDVINQVRSVDPKILAQNMSTALDSLVTHPDRNSPVVLGVKITNESLGTVVDVLQKLPPDQLSQLQTAICRPSSASAK